MNHEKIYGRSARWLMLDEIKQAGDWVVPSGKGNPKYLVFPEDVGKSVEPGEWIYREALVPDVVYLQTEVERLLSGIRLHRDQRGHDRCHLDDLELYKLLPEGVAGADLTLPPRVEFLEGCTRFYDRRKSGVSFQHCSLVEVMKERDALRDKLSTCLLTLAGYDPEKANELANKP